MIPVCTRLYDGLALHDARRLELERAGLVRLDRAEPVERLAERIDDAADEGVADGNAHDLAGALHGLALGDELPVAEERAADVVLLEVERDAGDAVLELEHLHGHAVLEAVHAREAVSDLQHRSDLGEVGVDVVGLDPLLENRGDLLGANLHVGRVSSPARHAGRVGRSGPSAAPVGNILRLPGLTRSQRRPIYESRLHRPR